MKTLILLLSLTCTLLIIVSCKRVKEKVNAEKSFVVYFADSSGNITTECFDRVYGSNNKAIIPCTSPALGISLPLSIIADSSKFFFEKEGKINSLTIRYKKNHRLASNEYEMRFQLSGRPKTSFDSISFECTPQILAYCETYEGLFAILYH